MHLWYNIIKAYYNYTYTEGERVLMEYLMNVLSGIWNILSDISVVDIIDITIVSFVFYYLYKFIRERRAGKLAVGILILLLVLLLSEVFDMYAIGFLLTNFFQVGIIAIIIVFQPELRSALEKVGAEPLKSLRNIGEAKTGNTATVHQAIAEITQAVCDMSLDKTGALIVIERSTKLGDIVKSGTPINADVSSFLLRNIFFNKAPLHDGAVVIRKSRIHSAGCFLPLSTNDDIVKDLGTRHRAAIGMSENSDAVVVVVSEETGTISIALNGQLKRNFSYNTLRKELTSLLVSEENQGKATKKVSLGRIAKHFDTDKK